MDGCDGPSQSGHGHSRVERQWMVKHQSVEGEYDAKWVDGRNGPSQCGHGHSRVHVKVDVATVE